MNIHKAIIATCILFSVQSSTPIATQKSTITEIDKFVTQTQKQLRAIEATLRSLNITIMKEKTFAKRKQGSIQAFFSQLMMLIESIKKEPFRNADLQSCQVLVDFNHQLVTLINKHRLNKFRSVGTFDTKTFLDNLQRKEAPVEESIIKKFNSTWKTLALIDQEGLGLTRMNRFARWIDDKIIARSQRYSLATRTVKALSVLFFAGYFYNKFHKLHNVDVSNQNIVKPIYNFTDKIDSAWSGLIKHKSPIGEVGGGILLGYLLREFYQQVQPEIEKKIKVWLNKAKGGSYIKEAHRIDEKIEKVRFKDIYGQDEIKRYFKFLVDYLEDSETHDRQGIRPSRGILCIGDTRTGKTFCINAFLEETNLMLINTHQIGKFRLIKPSILKIKIDGMEKILQDAKAKAPCIIFIDEIDLLDLQRTGENRTLSEFLTAMGDAVNSNDSRRQIFIIAATNCPETLDKALRQPGRFGKELRFEYPNFKDRFNFIESKIKEFILPDQEKLFNVSKLAHYTYNQSYEAMHLFIKDAMMKAKLSNNGELTQSHLENALEENVLHIIPSHSKDIPLVEQRVLAAHFAGQALALSLLKSELKLGKVTIKQVMTELEEKMMGSHLYDTKAKEQLRFEYGKLFTYREQDSIDIQTRKEKLNLIKLYVAGFVAEELLLGSCGYSCHAEKNHTLALSLAKSLSFQGIDESTLPKHLIRDRYNEAMKIKDTCTKEIKALLSEHQESLKQIMNQLLEKQTLDFEQIEQVVASPAA